VIELCWLRQLPFNQQALTVLLLPNRRNNPIKSCVGLEVLTAVILNVAIFGDTATCSAYVNRRFGESYHLLLQGRRSTEWESSVYRVLRWSEQEVASRLQWVQGVVSIRDHLCNTLKPCAGHFHSRKLRIIRNSKWKDLNQNWGGVSNAYWRHNQWASRCVNCSGNDWIKKKRSCS
jgi:hypothetical protein